VGSKWDEMKLGCR